MMVDTTILAVSGEGLVKTLGRLHVAVVHFPIALLVFAALIEAFAFVRRKREPSPTAGTFVILGALAAIASAAFGWILKQNGGEASTTLTVHQYIGFTTAAAAIVAVGFLLFARFRPGRALGFYRLSTLLVALLVAVAGHYGGSLTYGDTYLTEFLFPAHEVTPAAAPVQTVALTTVKKGTVDFVKDVQPILNESCYDCHGPNKKKGALRLDSRPLALKGGANGPSFVAGDSKKSLIIQHVLGINGKKRMPVNDDPLKPEQIATLTKWIDEGAYWPDSAANEKAATEKHWAFTKPVRPELPAVKDVSWVRNPIDNFVLARLEKEGLKPSPEANRATLIRRVSLDLVGLPPTPQEVDDFVNDASPNAYEKVVDRLLASPHYGERWGKHWLDIARYADTNGYEKDNPRVMWPYRDWVINAINEDLPYDWFVIDQIAGDMLPGATPEQRIATGFHRNTMFNEEGGIDVEEFRFKALVDRVQTTGTAFLGLTVQCAQCHDHKYDPISQKDYYSLFALLDNADEPKMPIPDEGITKKRQEIQGQIDKLTAGLESDFPAYRNKTEWTTLTPNKITSANGQIMRPMADGSILVSGPHPKTDTYTLEIPASALKGMSQFRIEVLNHKSLPKRGPGRAPNGNFVLSEFTASIGDTKLALANARADYEQADYVAASAIDGNPGTGWAIDPMRAGNVGRTLTLDFKGAPESLDTGVLKITLVQNFDNHTIGHFRVSAGRPAEPPKTDLPLAQQRANFLAAKLSAWESEAAAKCVKWTVLDPVKFSRIHEGSITRLPDRTLLFTGDNYYREQYNLEYALPQKDVTAFRLEALPDPRLENGGPGRNPNGGFILTEVTAADVPPGAIVADASDAVPATQPSNALAIARASTAFPVAGIDKSIDGRHDTHWLNFNPGQKPVSVVYQFKNKLPNPTPSTLALAIVQNYHQQENIGRLRISVTSDPRAQIDDTGLPENIESALTTPVDQRTPDQQKQLKRYFLEYVTPLLADQRNKIAQLKSSMPKYTTAMVMQERATPRTTRIHHRGEFLQPKDPVSPAVPAILPQLPKDQPANRLTFARWLVSEDGNPLIGRVTMNRVWNTYFGRGLVTSVEDFGIVGEKPTHPELLDWLATELPRQHWSMKAMHRLIVTSATYRQSSTVTPELLNKDPQNTLYARGPRFRVEAETVRDIALEAAGLLSDKIGGPSVFPPQPPGVSELSYGPLAWNTSPGEDRYRRGLYTFLKRTSMYPGLTVFDAPSSETVCARRPRSNTPLQALTTLNDAVFTEAAQALAKRIMKEVPTDSPTDRATQAFRLTLSRPPHPEELTTILSFYDSQLERFRSKQADATKVASIDPKAPPKDLDVNELAAWTTVSRAILNLDETVTKE